MRNIPILLGRVERVFLQEEEKKRRKKKRLGESN